MMYSNYDVESITIGDDVYMRSDSNIVIDYKELIQSVIQTTPIPILLNTERTDGQIKRVFFAYYKK